MKKTKREPVNYASEMAYWSPETAAAVLDCGVRTAKRIADSAGATRRFGRRLFFNAEKMRKFIETQVD